MVLTSSDVGLFTISERCIPILKSKVYRSLEVCSWNGIVEYAFIHFLFNNFSELLRGSSPNGNEPVVSALILKCSSTTLQIKYSLSTFNFAH